MAKPLNPYQGPAPAAMSQMGQGFLEAGANIGRALQSGYESMGKGLAGGINAVAGEYAKYKDMTSQVKAAEKSYETLRPYFTPEMRESFDAQVQAMNEDPNLSLRDKAAFWDQTKGVMGNIVSNAFAMQKQKQELDAAMARTKFSEGAATGRQAATLASQESMPARQAAIGILFGSPAQSSAFQPTDFSLQPARQNPFAGF